MASYNKDNGGGRQQLRQREPGDAVAEFAVLTTNFGAEHGQDARSRWINVALKSSTPSLRGVEL